MPILASLFSSLFSSKLKPANENTSNREPIPAAPASATQTAAHKAPKPAVHVPLQPRAQYPPVFARRSLKQLGLLFGGAGFLCLSILITRRAIHRHRLKARLKFYQHNDWKGVTEGGGPKGRDPMVAVEALGLATLNTVSAFIMTAGGVSWAFDISSVADLRAMSQRSIMKSATGITDEEGEQAVVEWMAKTLGLDLEEALASEAGKPAPETSEPAPETTKPASDEASNP